MTETPTTNSRSKPTSGRKAPVGRLFMLELSGGRIHSMNPDGSGRKVIVTDCRLPDGIAVDVEAGHIYWTNMGSSPGTNDGSIERADIDGANRKVIVPPGGTFTPKQVQLDKKSGKLYWCDREGMRVMCSNLDGSQIETLVETGRGDVDRSDLTRWCVGITIDPVRKQIYWTQKGPDNGEQGRILRAGLAIPGGETAANRSDIEVFFDRLPEPIDLELDRKNRVLYWTDRGDPPRGNTVNRADASDGRDRHRAGCPGRSDVCDRFWRIALFRQARRVTRGQPALWAGQSHRHRLHRNLKLKQRSTSHER
jgi:hypothetical protein